MYEPGYGKTYACDILFVRVLNFSNGISLHWNFDGICYPVNILWIDVIMNMAVKEDLTLSVGLEMGTP